MYKLRRGVAMINPIWPFYQAFEEGRKKEWGGGGGGGE